MAYRYKNEFEQALENTKTLKLPEIDFEYNNEIIFDENPQNMKNILSKIGDLEKKELAQYIGNFGNNFYDLASALVANCTPIHYKMKPYLENLLNQNLYFTTGYISFNDEFNYEQETYYKMTLERAQECIDKKIMESNHHVWLTTQSLEIIDLTFGITYMMTDQDTCREVLGHHGFEPWMGIITKHPDNLTGGMQYHPLLIGDSFYNKCGLNLKELTYELYG